MQARIPVREGHEAPSCKIAMIEIVGRVGDRLATPVGADARAIDRIALAQEHALETLAAVPAILPHLRAGGVPHDQPDAAPFLMDEIFDIAMVAGERLAGIAGFCDDLAADLIGAGRFQDDRRLLLFGERRLGSG